MPRHFPLSFRVFAPLAALAAGAAVAAGEADPGEAAGRQPAMRAIMAMPEVNDQRLTPVPALRMDAATVAAMVSTLRRDEMLERLNAAWALGEARVDAADAVDAAAELLKDDYPPARQTALYMLGRSGLPRAAALIEPLFADPEALVRAEACRAAAELARAHGGARLLTPMAYGDNALPVLWRDDAPPPTESSRLVTGVMPGVVPPGGWRYTPGTVDEPAVRPDGGGVEDKKGGIPPEIAALAPKLPLADPDAAVRRAAVAALGGFVQAADPERSLILPWEEAVADAARRLRAFDAASPDGAKAENDPRVLAEGWRTLALATAVGRFPMPGGESRARLDEADDAVAALLGRDPTDLARRDPRFDEARLAALDFLAARRAADGGEEAAEKDGGRAADAEIERHLAAPSAPLRRAAVRAWSAPLVRATRRARANAPEGAAAAPAAIPDDASAKYARLLPLLNGDGDPTVRAAAALAFGRSAGAAPDAVAALAGRLDDPSRFARRAASVALVTLARDGPAARERDAAEVAREAAEALRSASGNVRCEGLWILGQLAGSEGREDVLRLARAGLEKDGSVREAALALRVIGAAEIKDGGDLALRAFLGDHVATRMQGAWALGRLRHAAAVKPVSDALQKFTVIEGVKSFDYGGLERTLGYWALARVGDRAALEGMLAPVVRGDPPEDAGVVAMVAAEIAARRAEWAVPALERAVRVYGGGPSPSEECQALLADAVGSLTGKRPSAPAFAPSAAGGGVDEFFLQIRQSTGRRAPDVPEDEP